MERHDPRFDKARLQDSEPLYIRLLGGFRVSVGEKVIEEDEWRLKKARSLLKLLALAPNHRLHREQVLGLLWPEFEPEAAANNLNYTLHVARRVLGGSSAGSRYLCLEGDWLSLCPDGPLLTDVESFEGAISMARRNPEDPAAYRAALERYAGELLPEDRYEEWAEDRREELRGAYLGLLLELARVSEARGEPGAAIEALGRVVAEAPEHEEARVGLMRLYAASGQRHQALRHYEQLEEALKREYEAEPGAASRRLYEEILAGGVPAIRPSPTDHPPVEPPEGRRHNLPAALSSFVGREREIDEIEGLLCTARLLTLTGTGGAGKTRLALEVAQDVLEEYPDGAWLVELAPLPEGELAPRAVAAVLGVREQPDRPILDTLVDHLRMRQALLVLDNCEHVIDAAARLAEALLSGCPNLKVLATSREALRLWGETLWRVPSLSLPDPEGAAAAVEDLGRSEAVRLFGERARYQDPSFELTERNAGAVGEICRRLEGIPLALELAAARVRVLSAEQMAARLDDALGLLRDGGRTISLRQRTLRGALDWSYELLSVAERELLGRLSVFAGSWTLEAAEVVGAGEGIERVDVLDLISRLVDKSLVVAGVGAEGALRYRFLEPVRHYGRERLEESGEAEATLRRHAAFFLALAEQASPELKGPRQVSWLERLDREHDNLRAATRWLLERSELEKTVRLGWALWLFWWIRGYFAEGRRWMEEALAKGGAVPPILRARALFVAGTMACGQDDCRLAVEMLEESLELFRGLEDERGASYALSSAGFAAIGQGQHQKGIARLEEAVDLSLKVGEKWGAAFMLCFLAVVRRNGGDLAGAGRLAERGLALSREIGDRQGTSVALYILAGLAHASSDHERARGMFEEGLELSAKMGDQTHVAYCLEGLAAVAASEGKIARAARLWGAAEALLEKIEPAAYIYAPDRSVYQNQVTVARTRLGEGAFEEAWAEGKAMPQRGAVEYALATEKAAAPTQEPPASAALLTRREREVAELVARGMTNRRIAQELVISERTVGTHLGRIFKKLGLPSRERLAAWVVEQRPVSRDPD